jgi:hypothetical protein
MYEFHVPRELAVEKFGECDSDGNGVIHGMEVMCF